MIIIGVQNPKGGATKSTTTVNLGKAFQQMGLQVALAETDTQGTLREWAAKGEGGDAGDMPVIQLRSRDEILGVVDNKDLQDIDVLLIDGVANGFKEYVTIQKISDLILIVTQPSPADLQPLEDVMEIMKGKDTPVFFLITRTKKGDDLVDRVRSMLEEYEYPVLQNTIRDLKGFKTSFAVGKTVYDFKDFSSAQEDVSAVANELLSSMGVEV